MQGLFLPITQFQAKENGRGASVSGTMVTGFKNGMSSEMRNGIMNDGNDWKGHGPDSLVFYVLDWLTNSSTYMKIIPDERRKPGQLKPYEDYYRES